MKHIILIASILSFSSFVHAIGSQQLLKELSELQVINFSVVKQKSLSLPTVSSSLLSDEKLAEVFK
jgi:Iap family predicted aminopeptidase